MIRSVLLLAVVPAFLVSSAIAQSPGRSPLALPLPLPINTRGTPDDQKACQSDAKKLCRSVLTEGDFAVLQCFQSQRAKLSAPCRAVLAKYGQ
jgi:hypothetical protein